MSRWTASAWAVGAIVAAAVCHSLLSIPIQTTDSLVPILQAQASPSLMEAVRGSMDSAAYLRPLRIAQIQILFDASNGRYFLAYKAFHVALTLACVALFLTAARVRTRVDFVAMACAITILTGMHTFLGTVWEAYPINHFLEVVVLCLLALVLAQSRGGWWADAVAVLAFVVGALTLESGLLVWVVIAAGYAVGMRGISWRGVAVVSALLVGYLYLRFGYFSTGLPTLVERSTGFGLERLDPPELIERFGSRPYLLYVYNVVSSFLSVLFSQPRAGVWTLAAELRDGAPSPGTLINIACSTLCTAVIAWFAVRRWPAWKARRFDTGDRIVLVGGAVLVANAALSYGYTKYEIMSVAGAFYALAAYVAIRSALEHGPLSGRHTTIAGAWAVAALFAVMSGGWALRAVGLHYLMHQMSLNVRNEWVHVDDWLIAQNAAPATPEAARLVDRLRTEAINHAVANPYFLALQGTVLFR